ncbi:MAG: signal peptidase I [Leptospiraceae bacterium]|nr:signal peptidase I [Leptospiraceae bacterium]MCP5496310.1 signal peptidase I [Leptospiraceae bacterium]
MYKYDPYTGRHKKVTKNRLRNVLITIVIAFLLSILTRKFILFPYTIKNDFMEPTYAKGKTVYITPLYNKNNLVYGDIVFVRSAYNQSKIFIARVIGRPTDRVYIKNRRVYINDRSLELSNKLLFNDKRPSFPVSFSRRDNMEEIFVKEDSYFLLADNRDIAFDSREMGLVHKTLIIGKIVF